MGLAEALAREHVRDAVVVTGRGADNGAVMALREQGIEVMVA